MTRETLTEILRHITQATDAAFVVPKGREVALHLGRPGEALAVGPVARVDLDKNHVRVTTTRGQQFFATYEDISVVAEGPEGRSGFLNG
jgi:hypothetical protein